MKNATINYQRLMNNLPWDISRKRGWRLPQMLIPTMLLNRIQLISVALLLLGLAQTASAQFFGRNKPNYENFDFEVYQSPHFDLYTYLENPRVVNEILNFSEEWYRAHQSILNNSFTQRNPLLIYANHADFQQTNAIQGTIGVGTGGVTEAFKNRVILPVAMSNQQTHHVLGHELVHAFQYNMIINGDSTNLQNIGNIPLWMVEGLAEYLSIGGVDPHTAMWMRDAVLNDDVPTISDLNNPRYFPYRYGQAFWAFVTGLKGDDIIAPYFQNTAKYGLAAATRLTLGMDVNNLSRLWVDGLKRFYDPYIEGKKERFVGRELISQNRKGGRINVAPQVSPNGRYVLFLSEKDIFSIDVFLADARSGDILRKVASSRRSSHIDDFSYIESAGAWSPNSKQFAIVGVSKGDNILIINDAETGKTVVEAKIPGVPAFSNPTWSPNGRSIVFTGLVDGQQDLYQYDIRREKVTRLTNDIYSEMHPSWSADGSTIYFASDQISREQDRRFEGAWRFNLAALDITSGLITNYDVFPGADNLNPLEDAEGNLIFLSNRDGYRNVYRFEPGTGDVYQLTDLLSGVSGITQYAPAISVDRRNNRLVYTYFSKNTYSLYQATNEQLLNDPVDPGIVNFDAARLPRLNKQAPLRVDAQLDALTTEELVREEQIVQVPYKPKFQLDYAGGGVGVGVGTSSVFGNATGGAGSVQLMFSDILGENQFFTSANLNGQILDFGGQLAYLNRASRINWGGSVSHRPFITGYNAGVFGSTTGDSIILAEQIQRLYENRLSLFTQLPFNTSLRAEANASYGFYSYRVDQRQEFFDASGTFFLGQERDRIRELEPDGFQFGSLEAALVYDNSVFGLTAPLDGQRGRLGITRNLGGFNFTSVEADFRYYKFFKPFGIAVRALHIGRYGGNSDDFAPFYLGNAFFGFVRGLRIEQGDFDQTVAGRDFDELTGSKLAVGNLEIRIPFSGPRQLALLPSNLLISDLNFFIDGGLAFTNIDQLSNPIFRLDENGEPLLFEGEPLIDFPQARPIFTAGASLRINVFGALVVEPYYAMPLVRNGSFNFGVNILPGW